MFPVLVRFGDQDFTHRATTRERINDNHFLFHRIVLHPISTRDGVCDSHFVLRADELSQIDSKTRTNILLNFLLISSRLCGAAIARAGALRTEGRLRQGDDKFTNQISHGGSPRVPHEL